jgi:ABC-type glycerol-3-phosphate transport system substrate-binding protein
MELTMVTIRTLVAATLLGLALSGCSSSEPAKSATDLPELIPEPGGASESKGPNDIPDDGVHMFFRVDGEPGAVMDAYQSALEAEGWEITVVSTSGGDNARGGGGAILTGAHGDAYSVVDGGGWEGKTFVDVCAWPTKPDKPVCDRGER